MVVWVRIDTADVRRLGWVRCFKRCAYPTGASRSKEFMASKTVNEFAQDLKVAAKTLLAQLKAAGVDKAS